MLRHPYYENFPKLFLIFLFDLGQINLTLKHNYIKQNTIRQSSIKSIRLICNNTKALALNNNLLQY